MTSPSRSNTHTHMSMLVERTAALVAKTSYQLMKEHQLEIYEDDDFIVNFEADVLEKIKAKRRAVATADIEVE